MQSNTLIIISNRGQVVASTNYFDSANAAAGFLFLSWNAGAGRLLVPDRQKALVREMKTAQYVIVSAGPLTAQGGIPVLELLFEDSTDSPFVVQLSAKQTDRILPDRDQGGGFYISVWTRGGVKLRLPGRFRKVPEIPSLAPWSTH